MTKLYISEFSGLGSTVDGVLPIFSASALVAEQVVDHTAAAAVSNPFNAATRWIEIEADSVCSISITSAGSDATEDNMRMAANERLARRVNPGWSISAITNT